MPTKRMRRFFAEAAAVLLLAESARAKLSTRPGNRHLRALESVNSTDGGEKPSLLWNPPELTSMGSYFNGVQDFGGNVGVLKKSSKSSKSQSNTNRLTGMYFGYDTEDASFQHLNILCFEENLRCDIILQDVRFSTCAKILGAPTYTHGVAIAKGISIDSLNDFKLKLFCMQENETVIDFNKRETATLVGDMKFLPGGGIRRTETGFSYSRTTLPTIMDLAGDNIDINDKRININGQFQSVDFEDGSIQDLRVSCTQALCNIVLHDTSFSTCKELTDLDFFYGIGYASNISRDSLDNFDLGLYCVPVGKPIDLTREPITYLTGDLGFDREDILVRPSVGFKYKKAAPKSEEEFSVYEDITTFYTGVDTDDGSIQALILDCQGGLCNIFLQDSSFSTCVENTAGGRYLGGLAQATGVPQDSLYNFQLPLYCVPNPTAVIDYSTPVTNLTGDIAFLDKGFLRRTGTGYIYFNLHSRIKGLNGLYFGGIIDRDGGSQRVKILCGDTCEVILFTVITQECVGPSGLPYHHGIAVNSSVPKESLGQFELGLYCAPPETGAIIDYENATPVKTIKASIAEDGSRLGVAHLTMDGNEMMILKGSFDY